MRAAYMAQEILTSFVEDVKAVALQPSEVSGSYIIYCNEQIIFDRKEQGRFPEIKELKQLIRDKVAPEKSLGHSNKK